MEIGGRGKKIDVEISKEKDKGVKEKRSLPKREDYSDPLNKDKTCVFKDS